MHFAEQKRASKKVILLLLRQNSDFFSQVFTLMLSVCLLIFSGSPFHLAGFIVTLSDKKRHPVSSRVVDGSSNVLRLTQEETGCPMRTSR